MDKIELLKEYASVYDSDKNDFTLASLFRHPKLMIRMMIQHPLHIPVWRQNVSFEAIQTLRNDENAWDDLYILFFMEKLNHLDPDKVLREMAIHVNKQYKSSAKPLDAPDIVYRWSLKDDEPRSEPFPDMQDPWAQATAFED